MTKIKYKEDYQSTFTWVDGSLVLNLNGKQRRVADFYLVLRRVVTNFNASTPFRRFIQFNGTGPEFEIDGNTLQSSEQFRAFCLNHGNYVFYGGREELLHLVADLGFQQYELVDVTGVRPVIAQPGT